MTRPAIGKEWKGYYGGRRGVSGKVTNETTALNATGLLRHANPATTLKHFARAQKDEVREAISQIEAQALELMNNKTETIQ